MNIVILGPDGKAVQSEKYAPCPSCGKGSDKRVPSGGFGETYWVCLCGHEFRGQICPPVTV